MKKLFAIFAISLGISGMVFAKGFFQNSKAKTNFDFYVLSLSWSPTFCLSHKDNDEPQCDKNLNHGFVVHGLWPQYESGYPRACPSMNSPPNQKLINEMLDIMPSRYLVKIQWDRHGTCTGMKTDQYFDTLRKAYKKINIPRLQSNENVKSLEQEFVALNKGLSEQGIAIIRSKKNLSEVRICLTKELAFRECLEVDGNAAGPQTDLKVPNPH